MSINAKILVLFTHALGGIVKKYFCFVRFYVQKSDGSKAETIFGDLVVGASNPQLAYQNMKQGLAREYALNEGDEIVVTDLSMTKF